MMQCGYDRHPVMMTWHCVCDCCLARRLEDRQADHGKCIGPLGFECSVMRDPDAVSETFSIKLSVTPHSFIRYAHLTNLVRNDLIAFSGQGTSPRNSQAPQESWLLASDLVYCPRRIAKTRFLSSGEASSFSYSAAFSSFRARGLPSLPVATRS